MTRASRRFDNELKRFRALIVTLNVTLLAIVAHAQEPNSDFFIIYNQSTGAGLERPSYSLQIKLILDFTF